MVLNHRLWSIVQKIKLLLEQESSEYFTGTRRLKQGDIITACDAENAELAVITEGVESNVDDVRKLLQGGKYMINGIDELTGKCMFLSKNGEITKKKCTPGRNKYICQYKGGLLFFSR